MTVSATTYPYLICDGCAASVHVDEASRVEGPYGEFGEPGTAYFCLGCYVERREEPED